MSCQDKDNTLEIHANENQVLYLFNDPVAFFVTYI